MLRITAIALLLLVTLGACATPGRRPAAPASDITAQVDPRIELFAILARLAALEGYTDPPYTDYGREVDAVFAAWRDDPAVEATRALGKQHEVAYNAPVSLAVHLDSDLRPIAALTPAPRELDDRWHTVDLDAYLALVRAFAQRSGFPTFFEAHRDHYRRLEARYAPALAEGRVVAWFDGFFGTRARTTYVTCPSELLGDLNYGASARAQNGDHTIYQVLSLGEVDAAGLPVLDASFREMLVHEYAHAWVNPAVTAQLATLSPALDQLYAADAEVFGLDGYAEPRIVAFESVVRATTLLFARDRDPAAERRMVRDHENRGFWWIAPLANLMDVQRKTRGLERLDQRLPGIAAFFADVALRFSKEGRPPRPFQGPVSAMRYAHGPLRLVTPAPADAATRALRAAVETRKTSWAQTGRAVSVHEGAVDPAELAGAHLVAYGSPRSNPLVARLLAEAKAEVAEDHVTVAGRRFEGKNLVLVAAFAQAEAPALGAIVYASASDAEVAQVHTLAAGGFDWTVAAAKDGVLTKLEAGDFAR